MKKILPLLAILFLANADIKAQKSYIVSAGYGISRVSMPATKEIIGRYNETRTWLDKEMGGLNPLSGFVFSAGVDKGNYTFHVGLNLLKSSTSASGTPSGGTMGGRDLQLIGTFYSFNGLWDFGSMWDKDYGLGLNMGIALGGVTYNTKVTGEDDFKKVLSGDGAGLFLGLFYEHYLIGDEEQGIGVRITPYYKGGLGLIKTEMNKLKSELDAVNAGVPLENPTNGHGNLGLNVEMTFRLGS